VNKDLLEKTKKERNTITADHRLLGQQLNLLFISEGEGVGFTLWHSKGASIRNKFRNLGRRAREERRQSGLYVTHSAEELWTVLGHLKHYKENIHLFEERTEGLELRLNKASFFPTGSRLLTLLRSKEFA
jgi:threonyl-tRNA synthetase